MTADHPEIGIDEYRDVEAEGSDASSDLPDLLLAMLPRVTRVGFQQIDRPMYDSRQTGAHPGRGDPRSSSPSCSQNSREVTAMPVSGTWQGGPTQPVSPVSILP